MLQTFSTQKWNEHFPDSAQQQAIKSLEDGNIIFFPDLAFSLSEQEKHFLSPHFADPHAKNISYHADTNKLWGVQHVSDTEHQQLKLMLSRFSQQSFELIRGILPHYAKQSLPDSYRPCKFQEESPQYARMTSACMWMHFRTQSGRYFMSFVISTAVKIDVARR